ncbi:MAG: PepSY-like domain-containing protein [Bacteroidia bacterium]
MKKIILFAAIGFITITANAQKVKEADVPAAVKATFTKTYPNTKAKSWEKENGDYEAEFDLNKVEMSVLIDPNGNITETETEIKVTELPKAVMDYCAKNYPDKKIAEASKIVDAKGVITYEAEINKMDVLFDANAAFIKESKDND